MTEVTDRFLYGELSAEVRSAAGVKGMLIRADTLERDALTSKSNRRAKSRKSALPEERLKLGEHWANVGDKLGKAVDEYSSATSTLESRVLVSARRLRELKAGAEGVEIEVIEPVERTTRVLQAPELSSIPSDGNEQ